MRFWNIRPPALRHVLMRARIAIFSTHAPFAHVFPPGRLAGVPREFGATNFGLDC
jgi:hypothetical protein